MQPATPQQPITVHSKELRRGPAAKLGQLLAAHKAEVERVRQKISASNPADADNVRSSLNAIEKKIAAAEKEIKNYLQFEDYSNYKALAGEIDNEIPNNLRDLNAKLDKVLPPQAPRPPQQPTPSVPPAPPGVPPTPPVPQQPTPQNPIALGGELICFDDKAGAESFIQGLIAPQKLSSVTLTLANAKLSPELQPDNKYAVKFTDGKFTALLGKTKQGNGVACSITEDQAADPKNHPHLQKILLLLAAQQKPEANGEYKIQVNGGSKAAIEAMHAAAAKLQITIKFESSNPQIKQILDDLKKSQKPASNPLSISTETFTPGNQGGGKVPPAPPVVGTPRRRR